VLSTFIIENYLLVRILLIVALVVAVGVVVILARAGKRGRIIAAAISGASLVVVLLLTLTPDTYPLDGVTCNFVSYLPLWDVYNILLFLLPAVFAVVATRRPIIVLFSGILLSAVIEFVQYLNPVFGRRCDVDDWIANGTGTVIGVLIAVAVIQIVKRVGRRSSQHVT
jgi:glycopeptide antibiotics resistance protein